MKKKYTKVQFDDFSNTRTTLATALYFANKSYDEDEYIDFVKRSKIPVMYDFKAAKDLLVNNSQAGIKEYHVAYVLKDILKATDIYPDEYGTNFDCIVKMHAMAPFHVEIKTRTIETSDLSRKFGDFVLNDMDAIKRAEYIKNNPFIVLALYTEGFLVALVAGYYLDLMYEDKPLHDYIHVKTYKQQKNAVNLNFTTINGLKVIYVNELAIRNPKVINRCSAPLQLLIEQYRDVEPVKPKKIKVKETEDIVQIKSLIEKTLLRINKF